MLCARISVLERSPQAAGNDAPDATVAPDPVFVATPDGQSADRFVVMRQAVPTREMAVIGYGILFDPALDELAGTRTIPLVHVSSSEGDALLLDVILKIPLDSLLSQMTLPQELKDALTSRTGPCAIPLQLAEACETWDVPVVMQLCAQLKVDIDALNLALTAAGAWARESVQELQAR